MGSILKEDILLSMLDALIGEIYPEIRAIAVKYEAKKKDFTIRYYLDREPTEDDYESVGDVIAEFAAHFKYSDFNNLIKECVFSDNPISKLDPLDFYVYARKEYS